MILSWEPVVLVDIIGSSVTLVVAVICARLACDWKQQNREDIFRDYIFLLTLAFVFFAVSRSFGHLVKQFLIYFDLNNVWQLISPFSGAVNSVAFIVIFSFGIYFQRFQSVHLELKEYKDNLEELVGVRTRALEEENRERRRAEEELRQSSATLVNIFNSTSPLCITSTDFDLLETNEAYRRIWPSPGKEDQPMKCYDSRPGSFCHTPGCPLVKVLQGEEEVICETVRKIGFEDEKVFLQATRPFRDADERIIGTVTSFQDITERKQTREELASERERLAVTLRSIGDGVITTDTDGRIVMLNKEAEKLCGWGQKEARGKPLHDVFRIINEKTGEPCDDPVKRVLATGNIVALANHTILISRDGSRRSIADSGAPIRDSQSRVIGVVLVFRDVTDRKRMEKELLKTQKLESVGILAGGIAHDFNNILAAILGNIDLAIHRLGENERVVPLLVDAEKASLRAKGLTQQLLTFARGGSPVRRTVSVAGIIRDSAVFVLRGSNVNFDLDVPPDLWLVNIDPGQMSQVIQNIIINARESMPEGGTVRVACRNHVGDGEDETVEITITDSGAGIEPEDIDKVFDPYFTTKKKGTGLGLSICHSIIAQHGGTITVSSRPGSGTVFTIHLPAKKVREKQEEDRKEYQPRRSGVRVLMMDDEEMVLRVAREMLVQMGHEVEVAKDGQEALDLYRSAADAGRKFDLVIMDLTIPGGMGGKDAVKEIHTRDPAVPVIVASGYSNDPIMASFEEHGFCAAVSKPFLMRDLGVAIDKALGESGRGEEG